jgi:hypothetical protein
MFAEEDMFLYSDLTFLSDMMNFCFCHFAMKSSDRSMTIDIPHHHYDCLRNENVEHILRRFRDILQFSGGLFRKAKFLSWDIVSSLSRIEIAGPLEIINISDFTGWESLQEVTFALDSHVITISGLRE